MNFRSLAAILFVTAYCAGRTAAQTLYFPTNVPSNWSAASGTLAISTNHCKCPTNNPPQCLEWNYGTNDTLTVTNPGISSSALPYTEGDLWVYNPSPLPGQQLTVSFVDSSGTAQYYYNFHLNYSGWRRAVKHYWYDMNGPGSNNNFTKVKITGPTNMAGQLFLDAVTWVNSSAGRNADLQNPPGEYNLYGDATTAAQTNYYHCYYELQPDIPTNAPTAAELNDLAAARAAWLADNAGTAPSGSSVASAYASWTNLNIVANGSNIKGQVISDNTTADTYYPWLQTIAQDVYWNNTAESSNKMNLFLRNWWDQGLDYNSGSASAGGSPGYGFRTVPSAFVLAYPGYDATNRQHAWQMFQWLYRMGHYWSTNWVPGLTAGGLDDSQLTGTGTDDVYLNTRRELGAILFLTPDDATAIQYLKGYKRYNERFLTAVNGTDNGPKVDGCGFHHATHYNHYMYAFNELTGVLNDLAGTQFEISSNAYCSLRGAVLAEIRMGNTPDIMNPTGAGFTASSLGGRYPLQNTLTPGSGTLQTLGMMGGTIFSQPVDPLVAQLYNRILGGSSPYAPFGPYGSEANPEGFYQFNYSPIGIWRQTNWVACMHGMNNDFWGTEIAVNQNVYGRYQSYGALEILNPGGYAACGWSTNNASGWDWNKPPGATTIVLPWSKLIFDNATSAYMEHDLSATNFAGALAFHSGGNNIQTGIAGGFGGLYACNFQETGGANHNSSFAWRKSFFCFTNNIICLGSSITNNDMADPTITTLFQAQLTNTAVTTVMNGTNVGGFPNHLTNSSVTASWLLDGYGTGYFVRPGATIRLDRTAQISPDQSGNGALSTNNYATAWINHGLAPANAGYEYVVVPNATSNAMVQFATNYTYSATVPYTVLECDASAHVVRWQPDGRIGYALFATNPPAAAVTNAGPLRSVSLPCLAMTQPVNGVLWLTVVNPDLNLVNNVSVPTNLTVQLAGNWAIASGYANASVVSNSTNSTTLQMQTVNGFPVETLLLAVSNSLTAPAGVIATAAATNQINLTWLPVSNATGYIVQRGGVNIAGISGTNYSDTGLTAGTAYTYTVLSTNAGGVSPQSMPATTATPSLGTTPAAGSVISWDADFSTAGDQDGNGTWNSTTLNWLNGGGNVTWVDNCTAVFGASSTTNCTVTLGASVAPANITVSGGGSYTLARTGAYVISTANGLTLAANGFATISAVISNSNGLTNRGAGTLTLSGTNTYTGGTTLTAGTVNVDGDQSAATGGWTLTAGVSAANFNAGSRVSVAGGKSITLGGNSSTGNTVAVAGTVANSGTLNVSRRGTLNLNSGASWNQSGAVAVVPSSNTSYPANMSINAGATFTYTGLSAIGVGPSSGNSGGGVLTIAGGTLVTGQGFANTTGSSTGTGTVAFGTNGTLRLTASITNLYSSAGSATSVTLNNGGGTIDTADFSATLGTVITGSGGLTKLGSGSLTLSASNSFTGGTIISNGLLAVNGYLGTGVVSVASGGTLGGTGAVGGAVALNGTVIPGDGTIGTLTTAGETWNAGGAYQFSLNNATNSSGWDLLNINGALNLQSATTNPFTIRLVSLTVSNTPGPLAGFSNAGTNVWPLANVSGGIQNFNPAKIAVNTAGFSNAFTGTFSVSTNAGSLLLTYAAGALVAPLAGNAAVAGGNTFGFSFSGPSGQSYHVYASTNLTRPLSNWLPVAAGIFGTGAVIYTEGVTNHLQNFFRLGLP